MNVVVAYTAVTHGKQTDDFAARFSVTYEQFPAGHPHELVVVCNGGQLKDSTRFIFECMNKQPTFFERSNDGGFDISGYIALTRRRIGADLMVCLGESCYFHKAGWLSRLIEAWRQFGEGMYGLFATHNFNAHMNTTGFACTPRLLAEYPYPVTNHDERYSFEHHPTRAFWRWLHARRKTAAFVTWDGIWFPRQWRFAQNILWRGDQSNLLCFCNHSDRFADASARTRSVWAANADQQFR